MTISSATKDYRFTPVTEPELENIRIEISVITPLERIYDIDDIELYNGVPYQGAAYFPTNEGLTLVAGGWPSARFQEIRSDIEGNVVRAHSQVPGMAERLAGAKREEKWYGTAGVPNVFRKPYGPGWALVGDAGYVRDPLTAQGISDGFIDAEGVTEAIDAAFGGRRPLEEGMAEHQRRRDERVQPMFQFTTQLERLEPPPPPMQALFGAMHGNQEATDQFFSALTGALPLPQFMAPENVGRIMAAGARV